MDDIDTKILEAINTVSPKSFISPVKVNEIRMCLAHFNQHQ
jgi:hypothetical protein